ncbi:MAG: hypothetical protein MR900_11090, partial [Prevotella sp.]|nr:hypothetical protein [Prevotella sp.]
MHSIKKHVITGLLLLTTLLTACSGDMPDEWQEPVQSGQHDRDEGHDGAEYGTDSIMQRQEGIGVGGEDFPFDNGPTTGITL